jgi:hypothetical protein
MECDIIKRDITKNSLDDKMIENCLFTRLEKASPWNFFLNHLPHPNLMKEFIAQQQLFFLAIFRVIWVITRFMA